MKLISCRINAVIGNQHMTEQTPSHKVTSSESLEIYHSIRNWYQP